MLLRCVSYKVVENVRPRLEYTFFLCFTHPFKLCAGVSLFDLIIEVIEVLLRDSGAIEAELNDLVVLGHLIEHVASARGLV